MLVKSEDLRQEIEVAFRLRTVNVSGVAAHSNIGMLGRVGCYGEHGGKLVAQVNIFDTGIHQICVVVLLQIPVFAH